MCHHSIAVKRARKLFCFVHKHQLIKSQLPFRTNTFKVIKKLNKNCVMLFFLSTLMLEYAAFILSLPFCTEQTEKLHQEFSAVTEFAPLYFLLFLKLQLVQSCRQQKVRNVNHKSDRCQTQMCQADVASMINICHCVRFILTQASGLGLSLQSTGVRGTFN